MSDPREIEIEAQAGGLSFDDGTEAESPGFEVVDQPEGDPAFAGKTRAELEAELKARELAAKEQTAALQAKADSNAALQGSFGAFGDKLEKLLTRQQQQVPMQPAAPAQPQETWDQLKERLRVSYLEDPVSATIEAVEKVYGPVLRQQQQALTSQSKELLALYPDKKAVFDRFPAEVEQIANQMAGNPRAFLEASEIVAGKHSAELVQDQAKVMFDQWVKEQTEKGSGQMGQGSAQAQGAAQTTQRAPVYTETTNRPALGSQAAGGKRTIPMTSAQKALYQAAVARGIDPENWLSANGFID